MLLRSVTSRSRRALNKFGVILAPKRYYAAGVLKSPYEDITIPHQTLPQFLWSRSSEWEDLPAVTCSVSGRSYTYGMAKMLTERFAKGLVATIPMETGDRIGLYMPNLPEYLVAIHGSMDAGFVPTFANPLNTTEEITRQFKNANVRCIVTIPQLLDSALAVAANLENYTFTINAGGKSEMGKKILALQEVLTSDLSIKLPKVDPEDIACLPYSSGTTGLPKGVALTHKNLIANMLQCGHPEIAGTLAPTSLEDQDRVLSVLPFFHIFGFNGILNFGAWRGVHTITMPRFTPNDFIACLEEYRPTSMFAVPSLVLFMATHPEVTPKLLESVERIMCSAAPITPSVIRMFKKKVSADFVFGQGYGMTEMSPCALCTPRRMEDSKIGSVGQVLSSTEAKLIDLTDGETITEPNKSGELLVRGPQIMKGYLNNPEATKDILDSEGWMHTGDVAYHDADGYFYIVDRTKELIKVKGNQVSPTELEALLMEIPGIADCAVVGVPDAASGEVPVAFVVKAPGSAITVDAIKNHVDPKVAPYKKLEGRIKVIDAIPRNPSGKIMRQQLRSMI